MTNRWKAALSAVALLVAGCGSWSECDHVQCGACAPPVQLKALDAETDRELDQATATGLPGSCYQGLCSFEPTKPGTYEVRLDAPDFMPRTVSVTVEASRSTGCCRCPFEDLFLAVKLQRAPPPQGPQPPP